MDGSKGYKKGNVGAGRTDENSLTADWDGNAKYLWDQFIQTEICTTKKYRAEILRWALKHRPNLWVTLSYRGNQDFITVHERLDRFLDRICQKAYGKQNLARGLARPPVFGFLEHPYTNKHFNLLIHGDERLEYALQIYGDRIWRKTIRSAGFHVEIPDTLKRVIGYCLKEQVTLGHFSTAYYYRNHRNMHYVK